MKRKETSAATPRRARSARHAGVPRAAADGSVSNTASSLSHVKRGGRIRMVDVGHKRPTLRTATAEAWVRLGPQVTAALVAGSRSAKGPVLETAELAGIMAAKRTFELIPLCHPIPVDAIDVTARMSDDETVHIIATVRCRAVTGVEMEALTAATVAALTIYDMCKSVSKDMVIESVRLLEKTGGKSGDWRAERRTATTRGSP